MPTTSSPAPASPGPSSTRRPETIGCLYVYPPKDDEAGVDAGVSSWVVADRADLDAVLYRHILGWLRAEWPFTRIRYAER